MSKRKEKRNSEDILKMNKSEEEIAKFLRFNCPTSTTLFEGNEVHYFSGYKAVDTLWDSKYGKKSKNASQARFQSRDECANYIGELFKKEIFFRVKKLVPKKKEDKGKNPNGEVQKSPKSNAEKRTEKKIKEEETVTETEVDEKKVEKKEKEEKDEKKKKKVKLQVHPIQAFVDDKDVYVWIFDPTPLYKKVVGVLMLLGTIVGCLFPLWPMWLRQGVYYLSLGGIGIFASIIIVAILRTILFGIIYAVTFGKHKLWILPNLTEDCGVLESFQPWYTYEYCSGSSANKKEGKKSNKKKKDKDSDDEQEQDNAQLIKNVEKTENHSEKSGDEEECYEKINVEDESELSEWNNSTPPSPVEKTGVRRRAVKI